MEKTYLAGGLVLVVLLFLVKTANEFMEYGNMPDICPHSGTGRNMTWEEARAISGASVCAENGTITDRRFCNPGTGTWWIDMEADRPGCNPACVIDVDTGEASINWRCLGFLG